MSDESRIKKAIASIRKSYDEMEKKGTILCGSPYSFKINGDIEAETTGRLAYGINSNVDGEFGVQEPETKEILTDEIDMKDISELSITAHAGDVVQAEIKTYGGDWIRCPVSSLKVSFDNMKASEFNVGKFKSKER